MYQPNDNTAQYHSLLSPMTVALKGLPSCTQLSIAFIRDGAVSFHGWSHLNGAVAPTDNAHAAFEIGSVTKAFTGYVLAQLAVENKVRLEDPIQSFLPFSLRGNPAITLQQLALHTSGLPRMPHDFEEQPHYDQNNPYKSYGEDALKDYLVNKLKMDSVPGETFQYSNLGYGLLGYIIARIEGKAFTEVVKERLFGPLQMEHSSFDMQEIKTNVVKGLDRTGNICSHWDPGLFSGCIGIISTAKDLSRFVMMIADLQNAAGNLQSQVTFSIEPTFNTNIGWGERLLMPENISMQGINGGTAGYGASVMVNRQNSFSLVVLSNIAPQRYMEVIYPLNKALFVQLAGGR